MSRVLVVGATGQLGTRCVEAALSAGHSVRAIVRPGSQHDHLLRAGVECVPGDLRDPGSLLSACDAIESVIATATVVFPRGQYSFSQDEGVGYQSLIEACERQRVSRFLFASIAVPYADKYLSLVPTLQMKAHCEELLANSHLDYTVFRCTPFMDDYFALMGSALPLEGEVCATLNRASGATKVLRSLFGSSIERWGIATVPGPASNRHAFVAVDDVARTMVSALKQSIPSRATLQVTGPESASWREVADIYSELLGRPVLVLPLPAWLLHTLSRLIGPISEAVANQLGLLWVLAEQETRASRLHESFPALAHTKARDYLLQKVTARQRRSSLD